MHGSQHTLSSGPSLEPLNLQEGEGVSPTAIREIMLLRELVHENIVRLDGVHINRAEPSLWLAFDYADHDLFEMIRFHRENRHNRRCAG